MNATHEDAAAAQPFGASIPRQGLARVVTEVMARLAAAISHELRIRRDIRQLMAMDEHMLRDIGLTRADIGRAARYGRD